MVAVGVGHRVGVVEFVINHGGVVAAVPVAVGNVFVLVVARFTQHQKA
jgi:hypothetical protein